MCMSGYSNGRVGFVAAWYLVETLSLAGREYSGLQRGVGGMADDWL